MGAGVAVGLALAGIDAKALVLGGLSATVCLTAVAVVAAPNAAPRPTAAGIAAVGTFSASVTASSFVYSLFRNVDYWILGARLGPVSVGYYWRAYQLGVDYQSKISQIMLRVAFPVYTRVESLDELRRLRRKIVRTHAVVIIPLMAFFIGTAPVLIPWVFGAAWQPAVRPAQIIAVAGIAYSIATGTGPLMVAVGKPHALLVWSVCELVALCGIDPRPRPARDHRGLDRRGRVRGRLAARDPGRPAQALRGTARRAAAGRRAARARRGHRRARPGRSGAGGAVGRARPRGRRWPSSAPWARSSTSWCCGSRSETSCATSSRSYAASASAGPPGRARLDR